MLSYSENILQALTGKSSINDVSEDELKNIADNYPYFGAAQFLLAKKLSLTKADDHKQAIQKAALHFTNELWLHYNFFEEETLSNDINVLNKEEKIPEIQQTSIDEISIPDIEVVKPGEVSIAEKENKEETETIEDASSSTQQENKFEDSLSPGLDEEQTELLDEPETNERLSNLLKEQAAEFEKPVEETELPVETTPPHRIDYFESQGIKLEEDKANDKLGKQLKRFTDWLKQMKRVNPNLNNMETDAIAESQVQNLAEHSNEPKEVVTEAMAEVLLMQGKPEQAILIYEKLSFINPSKSAYFAAKIRELKA
ncbi:MAG TPA: hypothetical protein VHB70_04150 [Parafilimonas sp.]|nr:hypothetical protein [Parafilimonas sp.]